MPLRSVIPIVLVVALASAAVWLANDPSSSPGPSAPSDPPPPRAGSPETAADTLRQPDTATTDRHDRVVLPAGHGELVVSCSLGPGVGEAGPFTLVAEPTDGGEPIALTPTDRESIVRGDLRAGRHRLSVARGPGDRGGAAVSAFWVIDPPSDIVDVARDVTTTWTARIVPRIDRPERGRAQLAGFAFLDHAPATDLVIRIDIASGLLVTHVEPDGSFEFDEVPAGLLRARLCSRLLRQDGPVSPILVYGEAEVAPPAGGIGRIEIHATTSVLEGLVRGPGGPTAARVELRGGGLTRASPFVGDAPQEDAALVVAVAADGRFRVEGLPSGRYTVTAIASELGGPPVDVQIPESVPRVAFQVVLEACVPVAGTVDVEQIPPGRGSPRWLSVRFRGPVGDEAVVDDGAFRTSSLIPGTYLVEFRGRGRGYVVREPIEIGEAGAQDLRLIPVRR